MIKKSELSKSIYRFGTGTKWSIECPECYMPFTDDVNSAISLQSFFNLFAPQFKVVHLNVNVDPISAVNGDK